MKYVLSGVFILYGMTTFQMITWTFKIGPLNRFSKGADKYGITYTGRSSENDSMFSEELTLEESQFPAASVYNSSIGRKREILSKLWKIYHNTKEKLQQTQSINFQPVSDNIYFLSAFYDHRLNADQGKTVLRIMGIAKRESHDNLLCSFDRKYTKEWTLCEKLEMSDNHERKYSCFMYVCTVPEHTAILPEQVFLNSLDNLGKHSEKIGLWIRTQDSESSRRKRQSLKELLNENILLYKLKSSQTPEKQVATGQQNVPRGKQLSQNSEKTGLELSSITRNNSKKTAICVSPLYGSIPIANLVQFIEIHRTLGVDHFFFYPMNISSKISQILKNYANKNLTSIIPWHIPKSIVNHIWYYGQVAAIQDCLYRTLMQNIEYVAFIDLDEIIIPKVHLNWSSMLTDIENTALNNDPSATVGAFRFKSAFFDPEQTLFSPSNHLGSSMSLTSKSYQGQHQMSYFRALQRNVQTSSIRSKIIVKPKFVEHMGIHHVSKFFNSSIDLALYADVSIATALVHHYRHCTVAMDPDMKCDSTVYDDSILKFEDAVQRKYDTAINDYVTSKK